MAGKNGKKGVDGNAEEVEDKAIPTPETPKAEVTAAAEPQKPNATPEGEDTYTSQQLFGQKTYDEQMKVENKFAGLNRTDEISQLGGASKLEVDLAQMKIFSTERVGDDVYAAILRGDVERVEAMVGLNSDRRLTEAQLLVLIKAKHEQEEEKAKKLAEDAYFAQELEKQEEASAEAEAGNAQDWADQNLYGAETAEPDYSLSRWDDSGNYHDAYGGYYDPADHYHDAHGGEVGQYGTYTAANGDSVNIFGDVLNNETHVVEYNTAPGEERVTVDLNELAEETGVSVETATAAMTTSQGMTAAALGVPENMGMTGQQAAAKEQQEMQNGNVPNPAPPPTAPAVVGNAANAAAATTSDDLVARRNAAMRAMGVEVPPTVSDIPAKERANFDKVGAAILSSDPQFDEYNSERMRLLVIAKREGNAADIKKYSDTKPERFLDWKRENGEGPAADRLAEKLSQHMSSIRARAAEIAAAQTIAADSVDLEEKPAPQATTTTTATPAPAGPAPVEPAPTSVEPTTDPTIASKVNTTALATKPTEGFYDELGYYHDDKGGWYDDFGGYYDAEGGYDDGMGTYYAADGGIHDKNGGYTWPDGSYQDTHGNYVDTKGTLYAVDGTVLTKGEQLDAKGQPLDYKKMLMDEARKEGSPNPFDYSTPPSAEKTAAFVAREPSWANKSAEEKAAWQASKQEKASASAYLQSDSYYTYAELPKWDPLNKTFDDPLNPGSPSFNQPQLA